MGTRRKSRELVLQMLFQADMGKQSADDVRRTFWKERDSVDADVRGFAEDLFRVALDRTSEIDSLIEGHAEHWRMDRMAAVDRNILRAAVAELLREEYCDLPQPCGPCASVRRDSRSVNRSHWYGPALHEIG